MTPGAAAGGGRGRAERPEVSVVVPAYNEGGNLRALYVGVSRALEPLVQAWELVIVDDGSADGTWEQVLSLHSLDRRVRGLRFSRNFGHQRALAAGLAHAGGAAVITMDADLQHPPEVLPQLLAEWRKGFYIVNTVRRDPEDLPLLKRLTSRLYYRVFSLLSGIELEPGMADFRLLDRQVVRSLCEFGEDGLFLRGLVQWVGFPSTRVVFQCAPRNSGVSKYSFRRMLKLAWAGISSFSVVPLRIASVTGLLTAGLAFLALVYAAGGKLLGFPTMPGWASAVSIVAVLFGILFILLGVIGEYLGRVLVEVKRRPRYLIRDTLGLRAVGPAGPRRGARGRAWRREVDDRARRVAAGTVERITDPELRVPDANER